MNEREERTPQRTCLCSVVSTPLPLPLKALSFLGLWGTASNLPRTAVWPRVSEDPPLKTPPCPPLLQAQAFNHVTCPQTAWTGVSLETWSPDTCVTQTLAICVDESHSSPDLHQPHSVVCSSVPVLQTPPVPARSDPAPARSSHEPFSTSLQGLPGVSYNPCRK